MKSKSHVPPSKIKYDQSHPTISIRVTRELYDELNEMRDISGKSLGDILREALRKQSPSAKKSYQLGYDAAKSEFAVTYKCFVCGGNITATSDKEKQSIAQYLREHKWGHGNCVK